MFLSIAVVVAESKKDDSTRLISFIQLNHDLIEKEMLVLAHAGLRENYPEYELLEQTLVIKPHKFPKDASAVYWMGVCYQTPDNEYKADSFLIWDPNLLKRDDFARLFLTGVALESCPSWTILHTKEQVLHIR